MRRAAILLWYALGVASGWLAYELVMEGWFEAMTYR
jgi:hypothetical protein